MPRGNNFLYGAGKEPSHIQHNTSTSYGPLCPEEDRQYRECQPFDVDFRQTVWFHVNLEPTGDKKIILRMKTSFSLEVVCLIGVLVNKSCTIFPGAHQWRGRNTGHPRSSLMDGGVHLCGGYCRGAYRFRGGLTDSVLVRQSTCWHNNGMDGAIICARLRMAFRFHDLVRV